MLGNAVFRHFLIDRQHQVWGTLRSPTGLKHFPSDSHPCLVANVDVLDQDSLVALFQRLRPDVVINCVGLIKQLAGADDPLAVLPINAMLPHRLARLCALVGARLIHISTDCVYSGRKGMYVESDVSDAEDLYGKSKYIGELHDLPHAITLRTSIIGHELDSHLSLIDWYLSCSGKVNGYKEAIFSGLPTVELARVICEHVIPAPALHGLYHVSAEPIDKFSLLGLVATVYGSKTEVVPSSRVRIDRSLDSSRFRSATGYIPPSWPELVRLMNYRR